MARQREPNGVEPELHRRRYPARTARSTRRPGSARSGEDDASAREENTQIYRSGSYLLKDSISLLDDVAINR